MKKQLLILSIISIGITQQANAALFLWKDQPLSKLGGDPEKTLPFVFTNATSSTMAVHPYNNNSKGKIIALLPPGSLSVQVNIPQGVTTVAVYQQLSNGGYKLLKTHELKGFAAWENLARGQKKIRAWAPNTLLAYNPSKNISGKTVGETGTIRVIEQHWIPNPGGDANYFLRLFNQRLPEAQRIKKG